MKNHIRIEKDLLGERQISNSNYWGVHTLRALENFPITGINISQYPELIRAIATVKKSAARANEELGLIASDKAHAIKAASDYVIEGQYHDQFVVDVIQGGAGTSTNMNANEVIANLALEYMGHNKGEYEFLHPLDHVNCSQSTNDVYPTSIKLGTLIAAQGLLRSMESLSYALFKKSAEFSDVLKIGRTQLQDAVPMTLGQEFKTYEVMVNEDIDRLKETLNLLLEVNMGATAIGTGINTDPKYSPLVCRYLAEESGFEFIPAGNLIEATQDMGAFVLLSGMLKRIAVKISKICNDLRLLSSGPQNGFGEINLPPRAAGSSIMPGKVNPVIPEVVNQIAFEVIGNDLTVTMAAEGGQLQLNAFEPIIIHSIFKSIKHLSNGFDTLVTNCIDGITANREKLKFAINNSACLATALNPYIGYEKSSDVIKTALKFNRPIREIILDKKYMSEHEIDMILNPKILTTPVKKVDFSVK